MEKIKRMSVAELFALRYGNTDWNHCEFIFTPTMIGFSATYVKSMTLIFQPFVPEINSYFVSAAFVGVVLFMTLHGG